MEGAATAGSMTAGAPPKQHRERHVFFYLNPFFFSVPSSAHPPHPVSGLWEDREEIHLVRE
jgi:hypothetical protein